jgi:myo-inositol-1(or 4)-monophosphatase
MLSLYEAVSAAAIDHALTLLDGPPSENRTYKTDRDYATETDYEVEDALRALLADRTPDVGFLGEERGHTGNDARFWCLDPVDGTTNYSRGLPNFGICLALVEGSTPVLGEIALPAHGERFTVRDGRAFLNRTPIHAAHTTEPSDALVALGDFATGEGSIEKNARRLATMNRLANTVGRVRMNGSMATDLAWLAAGRLDAVIVHSNKPWDMAAGVAVARASGVTVTHHDGSDYSVSGPDILAASPGVHAAIVALLSGL